MKANGHHTTRQPTRANQATATPAARPMLGDDAEQDAARRAANQAADALDARNKALLEVADMLSDIKSGLCALDMATDALGNHDEENAFYFLIKAVEEKVRRASAIVDAALIANRCPAAG
jgi:hypothetical protein